MRIVLSEHAFERTDRRRIHIPSLLRAIETIPPVKEGTRLPWYFSNGLKVVITDTKQGERIVITVLRKRRKSGNRKRVKW